MGLFDFLKTRRRDPLLEAEEKRIAHDGRERERRSLAADERTSQEMLYYLALHDPSDKVRRSVAANPSTPLQASTLLAKDRSLDVRMTIAHRLVRILPSLSEDRYSQLYAFAVQSLGMLALDEVLRIRRALAETLKDHAHTPPAVALQLARDLEREVSEPILRFCAALSDEDLVDILKTHPANWAAEAVARRAALSERVSRAVIETGNVRAGQYLIGNEGAEISPGLLELIVERAMEYPEWHKPLAARRSLPPKMAARLAAFVDKTVCRVLDERSDLDDVTIAEIRDIVQRRIDFEGRGQKSAVREDPVRRAERMYQAGELTEEALSDALAMGDRAFVIAALARALGAGESDIRKVFDARAPKAICAITWRAGFSMRLALRLQQNLGAVKPSALIYPRGGTDYPLTEDEMRWQLEIIGLGG